jgi:hypothetical protein
MTLDSVGIFDARDAEDRRSTLGAGLLDRRHLDLGMHDAMQTSLTSHEGHWCLSIVCMTNYALQAAGRWVPRLKPI